MVTKAIGFSNKYYTAWEIYSETETTNYGKREITHYQYIKNLSFDFDTAKSKWNGDFIEGLRGKSHSFDTEKHIYDPEVFSFGKYYGTLISENKDYDYMHWYYNQICEENPTKQMEIIKGILEPLGYVFEKYQCYSPDAWKVIQNYRKEIEEAKQRILNKDIDFIATSNLRIDIEDETKGYIEENHICYAFENVKELWYNGHNYGLPTINGKAKRIKNKKIIVTDFEIKDLEYREVLVKSFKIEKI